MLSMWNILYIYSLNQKVGRNNITERNTLIYTDNKQAQLTLDRPINLLKIEYHETLVEVSINNGVILKPR